jgi:aspartyl-tRNA(Asn)/glutamyl-tRNA(Gln) amidotransferase subunit A
VPTGVQIVARPYDDVTAFHLGAAAERELRWWADPAWRPQI